MKRPTICLAVSLLILFGACKAATDSIDETMKIACVGNSITYGAGMFNREMNAYPKQLQAMLGKKYQVKNFGVNGATLLKKGDLPYWGTEAYRRALDFVPDIVFVKLGSNESKQRNRKYLATDFVNDYKDLITSFRTKNPDIRVILMSPVPSFSMDSTSIWNPVIKEEIIPLIQKVAYETQSGLIDLHHLFVDKPQLFPDTIHPSSLGATQMAKRAYEAVVQENVTGFHPWKKLPFTDLEKHNFYGFEQTDFQYKGVDGKLVSPKRTAKGKPWVLRARFWGHEPQTDIALLERGFHIAYYDVSNLFGNGEAIDRWNDFYVQMIATGFAKKVVLEGMSRGGLPIYNWAAENPEKVACVYADAPVLDGTSWPGGMGKGKGSPADWTKFKKAHGVLSEETVPLFKGSPIHRTDVIAKAGFPMLHVCGKADIVVPVAENTVPFVKKIKEMGGNITAVYKPEVGHHPHSLENPTPIVDFVLRATDRKVNFAIIPAPGSEYRSEAGWHKGKGWWAQANDIDSLCRNSGKVDLLLIGNSITQGFGGNRPQVTYHPGKKAVEAYFKDLKIIGAGISGDRTQHVAWRLKNGHYEKCDPDFVSLAIGVNNFGDHTVAEIVEGLKQVLNMVSNKFPDAQVLFFGPLPAGLDADSDRRRKYNGIHREINRLRIVKPVHYFNMLEVFADEAGNLNRECYSDDGIHLKPKGYEVWAEFIRNEINRLKRK